MEMHHQSRSYTYDTHAGGYVHEPSPVLPVDGQYAGYTRTSYEQQTQGQYYYPAPANGNSTHVGYQNDPYCRAISPSTVAAQQRYQSPSIDQRYHSAPNTISSSSPHTPDPSYAQHGSYTYPYTRGHSQPPQASPSQYIPSELAQTGLTYANYPHVSRQSYSGSGTIPHSPTPLPTEPAYSNSSEYPAPPHIVPSSQPSGQRLSRISTGRPRTGNSSSSQSPTSATSPSGERFPCEKCGKTFSRSHDRKRHHETQHLACPVVHRCRYCEKEFSRADSLKRHLDNGCDEMPQ